MKAKSLTPKLKKELAKKHYSLVGNTSAVQICNWTKNSLKNKGVCWKEKFYGIKSHRCCQFSPCVMWCDNKCLHCWRPIEYNLGTKLPKVDSPEKILEGIINSRKKLLSGFYGHEDIDKKKFKEAINPTIFTFSLSGEPTLYPRLAELIQEIRKRKSISFIVTNGLHPEVIKNLEKKKALPTQLTVSMNAPNEKLFKIWHNSSQRNAWKKFNQSLLLLKTLKNKTRRVIRLTLVKPGEKNKLTNMTEENLKEYADLIKKASPDFIHVKGFKSLGYSRERGMGYAMGPTHKEVKDFAKKLVGKISKQGYKIFGEEKRSAVVLISNRDKKDIKIKKV